MRIGIFGGSFDPVHIGHLLLAECCREQCSLDEVWFVPADTPPHKAAGRRTSAETRVAMLRLATDGHDAFRVCSVEIDRGGVSYTVDTLATIHADHPDATLYLLLGADMFSDLPNWREAKRIVELALPVGVRRAGSPPPDFACLTTIMSDERLEQCRRLLVDMPALGISSTDIRRRVACGQSIRYQTPAAVARLIDTDRLYRDVIAS